MQAFSPLALSPSGRGLGEGGEPQASAKPSTADHPHPTLPLKGEG